jgi:hypothetical protein
VVSLKNPPLPYLKGPFKEIIIQTKLVGMSMTFHCSKLHLCKCNGSVVISIKQMLILNVNRPPCSLLFVFFHKNGLIKSCSSSEDLSEYKMSMVLCSVVKLPHSPQKFEHLPFLNGCSYGIKKYGVKVTFNGMTSLLNFISIYQLVQKLMGGQTHRQDGDLISLHFSFRKK